MAQKKLEDLISLEELENIITMYLNNVSLREIEQRTNHSRAAISRMLERLDIKRTVGNHYKKNSFDYDFFETIDNELKAYWLGFLYADGCILTPTHYGEQSFKLCLAKQDEEIMEKYKEDLKSTYPMRYDESKHKKNPNHQIQVVQEYRCQKTVDDLKRLGCVERKSLILKFPTEDQVPKSLQKDFIRGYFDGDGSISSYITSSGYKRYTVSIVGTESFIKSLYEWLGEEGSIYPDKRRTNSWYITIGGNLQIINFYHKIYDNSTRFLKRKHDKFLELLNKYDENQGINV